MMNVLGGFAILAVVTIFVSPAIAQEPTTAPTMSAIRIAEVDGKPVPQLQTVPRPSPASGELLVRVYAAVIPHNAASRRVFEKLGYAPDEHPEYGDDGDVLLSVDRTALLARQGDAFASIRVELRK